MENLEQQVVSEISGINARLLKWVDAKGRSVVGRAIGKQPNIFANLEAGRAKSLSIETIKLISLAYGDEFPEVYILTGRQLSTNVNATELLRENEQLRQRVNDLTEMKDAYKALAKKGEPAGFKPVGKYFTGQQLRIGFQNYRPAVRCVPGHLYPIRRS